MRAKTVLSSILTCFTFGSVAELHVRNSGIKHIEKLDVGMIFFVELENRSKFPIELATRMINCCENITPEDVDCEHMQLIGGDMGILNPGGIKNSTLVWPTLYLHERKGECNIAISYGCRNNQTGEIQEKVMFDTSVSSQNVPAILEGYYETWIVKKCPSVDLDPLDHCRPINCHVKYNGRRNYYNRKLQRCQPVPICIADSTKELPDVAYVPVSNTCRDLENPVNEMEIQALSRGEAQPAWSSEPAPHIMNMYCHRGYNDNATGFCICDPGWTSQPMKNVEPSTEFFHMCNVQMSRFVDIQDHSFQIFLVVIAIFMGILTVFCCRVLTFMARGFTPQAGPTVDSGQQTCGYFRTSAQSLPADSSCSKYQKIGNQTSSMSCPGLR